MDFWHKNPPRNNENNTDIQSLEFLSCLPDSKSRIKCKKFCSFLIFYILFSSSQLFYFLPLHDFSFDVRLYSMSQEHVYDPSLFWQLCSQEWSSLVHSLSSEKIFLSISYMQNISITSQSKSFRYYQENIHHYSHKRKNQVY